MKKDPPPPLNVQIQWAWHKFEYISKVHDMPAASRELARNAFDAGVQAGAEAAVTSLTEQLAQMKNKDLERSA